MGFITAEFLGLLCSPWACNNWRKLPPPVFFGKIFGTKRRSHNFEAVLGRELLLRLKREIHHGAKIWQQQPKWPTELRVFWRKNTIPKEGTNLKRLMICFMTMSFLYKWSCSCSNFWSWFVSFRMIFWSGVFSLTDSPLDAPLGRNFKCRTKTHRAIPSCKLTWRSLEIYLFQ